MPEGRAFVLASSNARVLGECLNPQPVWSMAQQSARESESVCPFCLAPPAPCSAVVDALRTGAVVMTHDGQVWRMWRCHFPWEGGAGGPSCRAGIQPVPRTIGLAASSQTLRRLTAATLAPGDSASAHYQGDPDGIRTFAAVTG